MKEIIITDTQYRMALSPIRELSKAGFCVTAGEFSDIPKEKNLGFFSKYIQKAITYPRKGEDFVAAMAAFCHNHPVLLPVNRQTLSLVVTHKEEMAKFCDFVVPTEKAMKLADDKDAMYEIAKSLSVPVPKTTSLKEHTSIEDMAKTVSFPCMIKFRNGEGMGKKPEDRYTIVQNIEEFITAYRRMLEEDENPIASDYIEGHDIGVALVMDEESRPVSFLCYESLREYPIEGGPTCFCRTIFDRKLLSYAVSLLQAISFTGVAMLDFRGTVENPRFLEINPRVWGSAPLTEMSGSTFFQDYVKSAQKKATPLIVETCNPTYTVGTKMRFTPQSFVCFLSHMKKSPKKGTIFLSYLRSFFDCTVKDGLFTFYDPKPYVRYVANLIKRSSNS